MATTITHAPTVNLVTVTIRTTAAEITAPRPLMAKPLRQPDALWRWW